MEKLNKIYLILSCSILSLSFICLGCLNCCCLLCHLLSALSCLELQDSAFQRAHDAMITSLLRQNDVATSFCRNNDVIIVSCARWVVLWSNRYRCRLLALHTATSATLSWYLSFLDISMLTTSWTVGHWVMIMITGNMAPQVMPLTIIVTSHEPHIVSNYHQHDIFVQPETTIHL